MRPACRQAALCPPKNGAANGGHRGKSLRVVEQGAAAFQTAGIRRYVGDLPAGLRAELAPEIPVETVSGELPALCLSRGFTEMQRRPSVHGGPIPFALQALERAISR
jgi:hypothetical protein